MSWHHLILNDASEMLVYELSACFSICARKTF